MCPHQQFRSWWSGDETITAIDDSAGRGRLLYRVLHFKPLGSQETRTAESVRPNLLKDCLGCVFVYLIVSWNDDLPLAIGLNVVTGAMSGAIRS